MQKLKIIFGAVVIIAIFGTVFYWKQPTKTPPKSLFVTETEPEVIRLSHARGIIAAPIHLALDKNYFLEEGLKVNVTGEFISGKESLEYMLAGNSDCSTPATTPVVFNSFRRRDFSILVTFTTSYEALKVIARKDQGITNSGDLKGKTIGVVSGTISEILMDTLLAYNKILPSEVTIKGFKGNELPDALISKKVDAISIWEPYADQTFNKLPGDAIKIPTSQVYRISENVAIMNDYAEQHPQVLVKLIRGLEKSVKYLNEHRNEAATDLSRILATKKELVIRMMDGLKFDLSLDQLLILTMENEARWAMQHLKLKNKKMPNYMQYIYYDPLEKVSPESVTLIHKMR